MLSKNRQFAYL